LFIWGMGKSAFFPSLRLLQNTQLDFSLFAPLFGKKILSFLLLIPIMLGFSGWGSWLRVLFFQKMEKDAANLIALSAALALFSLYVFDLAINGILYWPLTALFFLISIGEGLREWKTLSWSWGGGKKGLVWLGIPLLL